MLLVCGFGTTKPLYCHAQLFFPFAHTCLSSLLCEDYKKLEKMLLCVCVCFQSCQSQFPLFKHLSLYLKLVAGQHNLLMFLWREESLKHWEVNWLTRWGELLHPLSQDYPSHHIQVLHHLHPPPSHSSLPLSLPHSSQSLTTHLVTLLPPSLLPELHFARGRRLTHQKKSC